MSSKTGRLLPPLSGTDLSETTLGTAVVLDIGAASRGSGNTGSNNERDIRKAIIEADRLACVILLPENMFYNTSAPGIILVMTGEGERAHQGEMLLVNASQLFAKGRPES